MNTKKFFAIEAEGLFAAIQKQLRNNTQALAQGYPTQIIPVHCLSQDVTNIDKAFSALQNLLGREELSVRKLSLIEGQDELPPQLFVAKIDTYSVLAIGIKGVYFLDCRVYQITNHYRRGVAELIKIENGEITARYH